MNHFMPTRLPYDASVTGTADLSSAERSLKACRLLGNRLASALPPPIFVKQHRDRRLCEGTSGRLRAADRCGP
jgi:hypothetical protein